MRESRTCSPACIDLPKCWLSGSLSLSAQCAKLNGRQMRNESQSFMITTSCTGSLGDTGGLGKRRLSCSAPTLGATRRTYAPRATTRSS